MTNIDNDKSTSTQSILLIILKEVRLERHIHQAQIADWCGKSPTAWTKIEMGKSTLSLDTLFKACSVLGVATSTVLATTERYANVMSMNGCGLTNTTIDQKDDYLLNMAQEYYASSGYKYRSTPPFYTILNTPIYHEFNHELAPVFAFCLNEQFRKQQIEYKPTMIGPQT